VRMSVGIAAAAAILLVLPLVAVGLSRLDGRPARALVVAAPA
jgi:hypothetical protein